MIYGYGGGGYVRTTEYLVPKSSPMASSIPEILAPPRFVRSMRDIVYRADKIGKRRKSILRLTSTMAHLVQG